MDPSPNYWNPQEANTQLEAFKRGLDDAEEILNFLYEEGEISLADYRNRLVPLKSLRHKIGTAVQICHDLSDLGYEQEVAALVKYRGRELELYFQMIQSTNESLKTFRKMTLSLARKYTSEYQQHPGQSNGVDLPEYEKKLLEFSHSIMKRDLDTAGRIEDEIKSTTQPSLLKQLDTMKRGNQTSQKIHKLHVLGRGVVAVFSQLQAIYYRDQSIKSTSMAWWQRFRDHYRLKKAMNYLANPEFDPISKGKEKIRGIEIFMNNNCR